MRVWMRIDPDFARPTATAIVIGLPLRKTPLWEEPHEVQPESWTVIPKIHTSLASDASKGDVPLLSSPSFEKEPTFVVTLIWLP